MTRDIYTEPRVGDRVQVIPAVCDRLPEPLTIIGIEKDRVYWNRPICGQKGACSLSVWGQSDPSCGSGGKRLELMPTKKISDDAQGDMFGGVV